MNYLKKVAVIGELSGTGKCGLNVALPILAAAGVEACAVPVAVAAANTPDGVCVRRDLTADVPSMILKWKDLKLHFDAIACMPSGSGSIKAALAFADAFGEKDCIVMVDPQLQTEAFQENGMAQLCAKAGVIVPDVGEAACLLGEDAREGPYDRNYVEHLLDGLCLLGPGMAVIKGIWFSPGLPGAASFDCQSGSVSYAFAQHVQAENIFGAGDVFSSSLLTGLLNGMELSRSVQLAVDFTADCIRGAREIGTGFGLNFEAALPGLMRALGLDRR